MTDSRVQSVVKQTGVLAALTIVVTGLTFLFNLCGAISVAVLTGMMAGVSRRWKWQTVLVSLVPPFVLLALGRITRVDLEARQLYSVAGVCLGAFWATYLATFLVMFLEKGSGPATDELVPKQSDSRQELETSKPKNQLSMAHLQGTWLCGRNDADGSSEKKVLVVTQDKFSLSIVNADGRADLIAEGDVKMQDAVPAGAASNAASSSVLILDGSSAHRPCSKRVAEVGCRPAPAAPAESPL